MTRVTPKVTNPQENVQRGASEPPPPKSKDKDTVDAHTSMGTEDAGASQRKKLKRKADPELPAVKRTKLEGTPPIAAPREALPIAEGRDRRLQVSTQFHRWEPDYALGVIRDVFSEIEAWLRGDAAKPVAKSKTPPPGGFGKADGNTLSPSQVMFGKANGHLEIDRTMASLISAYRAIMNGDYESFTECQKGMKAGKLEETSFNEIVAYFKDHLKTPEDTWTLVVATLVNDIGKMLRYRLLIQRACKGVTDNHDLIGYVGISEWPELLPSYKELSEEQKATILAGLKMGVGLNVGQLAQCESTAYSLRSLTTLNGNVEHLHAKLLEIFLDMFGALGHLDARGSKTCVELTWQAYKSTIPAMEELVRNGADSPAVLEAAYEHHLKLVATRLGYAELDSHQPEDHALMRLLGQGRCLSHETAQPISDAFHAFQRTDADAFNTLVREMSISGLGEQRGMMLYWAPQVLENARNAIASEHPGADAETLAALQRDAFVEILGAFAKIYDAGRKAIADAGGPGMVEIEVKGLAAYTASAEFVRNPRALRDKSFKLLGSADSGVDWAPAPKSEDTTDTAVCIVI